LPAYEATALCEAVSAMDLSLCVSPPNVSELRDSVFQSRLEDRAPPDLATRSPAHIQTCNACGSGRVTLDESNALRP